MCQTSISSKQRKLTLIVFAIAASSCTLYLLPLSLHDWLQHTLNLSTKFADVVSLLINIWLFIVFYQIFRLALLNISPQVTSTAQQQVKQQLYSDEVIINSAANDLGDMPALCELLNQQLHAVSQETERAAYSIIERIQSIDDAINKTINSINDSIQTNIIQIDAATSATDFNVAKQHLLERETELLTHLSDASAALSLLFMNALSDIQFQDVTRQQNEQVQNAIKRLDTHIAQLVTMMRSKDFSNAASIKDHIEQIYESYVMEQQRDVHASALGDSASTESQTLQKIELF